jgi:hypothetical protein
MLSAPLVLQLMRTQALILGPGVPSQPMIRLATRATRWTRAALRWW